MGTVAETNEQAKYIIKDILNKAGNHKYHKIRIVLDKKLYKKLREKSNGFN